MGRGGFMRLSVHPIEADAEGETRPKQGMDDEDWQDLGTENLSESVQAEHTVPTTGYRGPSFGLDPTTAPDFMTQEDSGDGPPLKGARPPLITGNSSIKVNGTSDVDGNDFEEDDIDGGAEDLAQSDGNEYNVAKTGRLLTFADETGGALVEMSYSNRTHYSKQAGPGAVQGVPKGGCCAIQ